MYLMPLLRCPGASAESLCPTQSPWFHQGCSSFSYREPSAQANCRVGAGSAANPSPFLTPHMKPISKSCWLWNRVVSLPPTLPVPHDRPPPAPLASCSSFFVGPGLVPQPLPSALPWSSCQHDLRGSQEIPFSQTLPVFPMNPCCHMELRPLTSS